MIRSIIGLALVTAGVLVVAMAVYGTYRFRYVLNRMHAAALCDTLGLFLLLVGLIALESVTADEIDRILGQVLEAVDADFNTLLELGFANSIRKEWAWRVSTGQSLKNLKAFAHLIDDDEA